MAYKRLKVATWLGFFTIAIASIGATAFSENRLASAILQGLGTIEGLLILWQLFLGNSEAVNVEQSNRKALIENVYKSWIEGVLDDALRDAQFDIGLGVKPSQVGESRNYQDYQIQKPESHPHSPLSRLMNFVLRRNDMANETIDSKPETLAKIFNDVNRKLLILGAPASGKTVLLLQLAQELLKNANQDEKLAIPVVFNLSSWTTKREDLEKWITEELQRGVYRVPKKLAQEWIGTDKLIFLLDGLDEVAGEYRNLCIEKINEFLTPERQIVISSRVEEYEALSSKLNTNTAIQTEAFTTEQAEDYLKQHLRLEVVQKLLPIFQTNKDVWEEVKKPLFINILISTYRNRPQTALPHVEGDALIQVRELVIAPYINRQLQLTYSTGFSNTHTRRYLSWLAWHMNRNQLSLFYVEILQSDWVFGGIHFWLFNIMLALFFGVILGLIEMLKLGMIMGAIFGLFGGILGLSKIDIEKKVERPRWGRDVLMTLVFFAILGSIFGLLGKDLIYGLVIGLQFSIISLLAGTFMEMTGKKSIPTERVHINQGLRDTLVHGILYGIFFSMNGIFSGISFGLIFGIGDIFKHLILRFWLWIFTLAPRRFDKFLLHAKQLRLMRQVGGSFLFIHRYVQDYFATEYEKLSQEKN